MDMSPAINKRLPKGPYTRIFAQDQDSFTVYPAPYRVAEQDTLFVRASQVTLGMSVLEASYSLKKGTLPAVRSDPQVFVGEHRGDATSRRAIQEANLYQKRLIDFFNGIGLFGQSSRQ